MVPHMLLRQRWAVLGIFLSSLWSLKYYGAHAAPPVFKQRLVVPKSKAERIKAREAAAVEVPGTIPAAGETRPSPLLAYMVGQADKAFEAADVDENGQMDFDETYELALHLYVFVNRQAPIPPPDRETVYKLFLICDRDSTGSINRIEFRELATYLLERAFSRVIAFKMATLLGAPLLAEYVVRCWTVKERKWLPNLVAKIVPEKYFATVTSKGFCRTLLLLLFINTLGNLVLLLVNIALNAWLKQQGTEQGIDEAWLNFAKPWREHGISNRQNDKEKNSKKKNNSNKRK